MTRFLLNAGTLLCIAAAGINAQPFVDEAAVLAAGDAPQLAVENAPAPSPAAIAQDFSMNIVNPYIAPVFADAEVELASGFITSTDVNAPVINGKTATNPGWLVRLYTQLPPNPGGY